MKLKVSRPALQDLKDIKDYISNTLENPVAAENTIKKIKQSFLTLAESPYIGSQLKYKMEIETSYRFLTSGNYLIFYLAENDFVIISRVIYGKRNYAKLLFNRDEGLI